MMKHIDFRTNPCAYGLLAMVVFFASAGAWGYAASPLTPLTPEEQVAKQHLLQVVQREYAAMFSGNRQQLESLFVPDNALAEQAFKAAWIRSEYWRAWAKRSHIQWVGFTAAVRTPAIRFVGNHRVDFFAVIQEQYRYRYKYMAGSPVEFGIGTRHYQMVLQEIGTQWYIAADDFANPVSAESMVPNLAPGFVNRVTPEVPGSSQESVGAARAVAYAERYCGSAPGCGGGWNGRYNHEYRNFNGDGGDCTNFISQVLHAGGFKQTAEWAYDSNTAEGTRAWSNADGLSGFLKASERAVPYARGTYDQITHDTAGHPRGAIGQLRIGDLIGYQEHGVLVHSAIVVGFDPHGLPLTDTHTNDRFHAPWEFGWKKGTVYWLWHVHYPPQQVRTSSTGGTV